MDHSISGNNELKKNYGPKAIGQVIRILDKTSLIIDAGKGVVSNGDHVQVFEYHGELKNMHGDVIGSLEVIKADLIVERCETGYSICKTYTQLNLGLAKTPLLDNMSIYRHVELDVDENDISPMELIDKTVHIGDPVKLA